MIHGVTIKPRNQYRHPRRTAISSLSRLSPLALRTSKGFGYYLSKLTLANRNDLLTHLNNKLAEMRPARKRRHSPLGRFINTIKMERTENIELDGIIFCGLLELLDETAEVELNRRFTYWVPFEEVERLAAMVQGLPEDSVVGSPTS